MFDEKTKADIEAVDKQEAQNKRVLEKLLDKLKEKKSSVLAIRVRMGKTYSYVTSVPLSWVSEHVRFAKSLPVWKDKIDVKTGRIVIDEETLDELRQREPDWRRQMPMACYLAERTNPKFPPILVVAWRPWVNDPEDEKWIEGRAKESSIIETPLDSNAAYIDLDCSETQFYALDGQHRLMAILGLHDLLSKGKLFAKDANQKETKISITTEDIERTLAQSCGDDGHMAIGRLQTLMDESIGIEIIPAVMKGETSQEALERLRSIFVHVNMNAKRLTDSELALLDEDNGFSIVAREVMVRSAFLSQGRVDTNNSQLKENSKHYTTLKTLVDIASAYLSPKDEFCTWEKKRGKSNVPVRPSNEEIEKGIEKLKRFFDILCELPSHQALLQDQVKSAGDFRREDKHENILFRPHAQLAFANAMAELEGRGKTTEETVQLLKKCEQEGMLRLRDKCSIWFGVLCDVNERKMRRQIKAQRVCQELLVHCLGGGTQEDERSQLKKKFWEMRKLDNLQYVGLDGEPITLQPENFDDQGNLTKEALNKLDFPIPWI